ncbi:MAG: M60 family metallopeptidase, partial [Cellulosilyticaceae bacterium]
VNLQRKWLKVAGGIVIGGSVIGAVLLGGNEGEYAVAVEEKEQQQEVFKEQSASVNVQPEVKTIVEQVNLYRQTSISPSDPREKKEFNIQFHTSEPLGIHITQPTTIEVLIEGQEIKGKGQLMLHDGDNLKKLMSVPVGKKTRIKVPKSGQIFLDVGEIQYSLADNVPFAFQVAIELEEESYQWTPTYDQRAQKITEETYTNQAEFLQAIQDCQDAGMLMMSENVRLYMPNNYYLPKVFDPEAVLEKHEETIAYFNQYAGLDEQDPEPMHQPRKNFVLVSARREQAGFMSAGNQMLDTHPKDSKQYFEPRWGMYHEYGHLYEQPWSHVEIWNNFFAKEMAERTFGFTFIWEDDRLGYESKVLKPLYESYMANEQVEEAFGYQIGLYFFVTLEELLGEDFAAQMARYWRENPHSPKKIDYVAYAVADQYGINLLPYLEVYGLACTDDQIRAEVIDKSKQTLFYVPKHPEFEVYAKQSAPPTVKVVYEGENTVIEGIANPGSQVVLQVDGQSKQVQADTTGHFEWTLVEPLTLESHVTLTATEVGKAPSKAVPVQVTTRLAENKIHLQGYMSNTRTIIGFDPVQRQIEVKTLLTYPANYQASGEYFAIAHYGADGELIQSVSVKASDSAQVIESVLDGQSFEFGDFIRVKHQEPYRTLITGKVEQAPDLSIQETGCKNIKLSQAKFVIQKEGLVYEQE